jgi:hypothetical protein
MKESTLAESHFKSYFLSLWDNRKQEKLVTELSNIVAMNYWYMAGNLYELLGDIGHGPGHREDWYEGDYYPKPYRNARTLLSNFIDDLSILQIDRKTLDKFKKDETFILAMRLVPTYGKQILSRPYQIIVLRKTDYQIGAARIFLSLILDNTDKESEEVGLAGLIAIAKGNLNKLQVNAFVARQRYNHRRSVNGT